MTLRMADDIYASNLPVGYDAYAGYINGNWPDYNAIVARFPNALHLSITVFLANAADCLDIEQGDATPDQAATFVNERHLAGIARPCLYASISAMPTVVANLAGIPRATYRLWSAHYSSPQGMHICGPTTCNYGGNAPQCDGTQWASYPNFDDSILADDFFNTGGVVLPKVPGTIVSSEMYYGLDPQTQLPSQHFWVVYTDTADSKNKLFHMWYVQNKGWFSEGPFF